MNKLIAMAVALLSIGNTYSSDSLDYLKKRAVNLNELSSEDAETQAQTIMDYLGDSIDTLLDDLLENDKLRRELLETLERKQNAQPCRWCGDVPST